MVVVVLKSKTPNIIFSNVLYTMLNEVDYLEAYLRIKTLLSTFLSMVVQPNKYNFISVFEIHSGLEEI